MGGNCVFVIYQHKGKWNSFIFILLLFCLSHQKHIQDKTRWLFIIILHFVKSFVWYLSVFNQYSYYCDLFCLGAAYCIYHRHHHVSVSYSDTTKIMVLCISSILIQISYFSLYIIPSYRARSSEPQFVSRYSPIVSEFCTVLSYFQLNNTTYQKVSAISWKY